MVGSLVINTPEEAKKLVPSLEVSSIFFIETSGAHRIFPVAVFSHYQFYSPFPFAEIL